MTHRSLMENRGRFLTPKLSSTRDECGQAGRHRRTRPLPQSQSAIDMMRQFSENLHANTFNVNPTAFVSLPDRLDQYIPNLDIVQAEINQGWTSNSRLARSDRTAFTNFFTEFVRKKLQLSGLVTTAFVNWSKPRSNIKCLPCKLPCSVQATS